MKNGAGRRNRSVILSSDSLRIVLPDPWLSQIRPLGQGTESSWDFGKRGVNPQGAPSRASCTPKILLRQPQLFEVSVLVVSPSRSRDSPAPKLTQKNLLGRGETLFHTLRCAQAYCGRLFLCLFSSVSDFITPPQRNGRRITVFCF